MECSLCKSPYETSNESLGAPLVAKCGHTCCRKCFQAMATPRCFHCHHWSFQEPSINTELVRLLQQLHNCRNSNTEENRAEQSSDVIDALEKMTFSQNDDFADIEPLASCDISKEVAAFDNVLHESWSGPKGQRNPKVLRELLVIHMSTAQGLEKRAFDCIWKKYNSCLAADLVNKQELYALLREMCYLASDKKPINLDDFIQKPEGSPDELGEQCLELLSVQCKGIQQPGFKFNDEQQKVIDAIIRGEQLVLMSGPAGTGKTTVYQHLCRQLKNKKILCTAWTGIAASLLPGGQTISSLFAFFTGKKSLVGQEQFKQRRQVLMDADIIIIDECSMLEMEIFHEMEEVLRVICKNNLSFGGKQILLGGDFRQISPVDTRNSKEKLERPLNTLVHSDHFKSFKIIPLTKVERQNGEGSEDWKKLLLKIGDGESLSFSIKGQDEKNSLGLKCNTETVFSFMGSNFCDGAILCPGNKRVDLYNDKIIKKLDGEEKTFTSTYPFHDDKYKTSNPPLAPQHELKLKVGSIVMLTRNLNVHAGLCNGTRLQVVDISQEQVIRCKFFNGIRCGTIVDIPRTRNTVKYENNTEAFSEFVRVQFPLRLGFAMTIHKAQGQTFEKVFLDLTTDIFEHGQLYVALSRCRSKDNIRVVSDNNCVANVVNERFFPSSVVVL